jgi:uncharacterized protein YjbI with pentapeptide repeats
MVNLLLVKNSLIDLEILENSLNSNTILLKDPSIDYFLNSINENTQHIGLVYHFLGYPSIEFFNKKENEYDNSGLSIPQESNGYTFIENSFLNMLLEVKKINPNIIFDLLTCNVTDQHFINDSSKLTEEYGFIFRYSTNEKGYGGDWIQESHNISIKEVYFTDNIDLWKHTLTLSRDLNYLIDSYPNIFELEVLVEGNILEGGKTTKILKLKQDFEWNVSNLNTDFITLNDNEIFDGQNFKITINNNISSNILGLFASSGASLESRPIIKNLKVECFKTLGGYSGILVRQSQKFFEVHYVDVSTDSTTTILTSYCGGIVGSYSGSNYGDCLITNCSFTGNINSYGGCIVGSHCAQNYGNCTVINCKSTGVISSYGGGITGSDTARDNGKCTITYCTSYGSIVGDGGGITGNYTSNVRGTCIIKNCCSFGSISSNCGGITGRYAGFFGECYISECYSFGNMGTNAGGITGSNSSYSNSTYSARCDISNCFSTGVIGYQGGGIAGYGSGYGFQGLPEPNSILNIYNCYSTGNILNSYGGGIVSGAGQSFGIANIYNCYSLGSIGNLCGGITGYASATSNGICNIYNCYAIGTLGSDAGGIVGSFSGTGTLTINNSIGRSPLVGTSTVFIDNNNSTDLNLILNNSNYVFSNLGWSDLLWVKLLNTVHPRIRNNFQIMNEEDLSNNDISGISLFNINLNKINLSNTNLTNSSLINSTINDSSLNSSNLTNSNLSNSIFNNVNLSNTNLINSILNNTNLLNTILTDSITGPLQELSGLIISDNYIILNNSIIGKDVDFNVKKNGIDNFVEISNNELISFNNILFDTKILGENNDEKYKELIKIYNFLKIPSNKIQINNLNKDGYWLNLSDPSINFPEISNNEYLYLLNIPENDVSINISNIHLGTFRKEGLNYAINNLTYYKNEKFYVENYRILIGSFLIEPVNIIKNINNITTNQSINIRYINELEISGNISNVLLTTLDASVNYLLYSGFRGGIIKFNLTSNLTSNITNFNEDPLLLEFDLPNINDTTKTLKLYKIVNNELVKDNNYPKDVIYNYNINKWTSKITTLSDFIIIDENAPNTLIGGDPYIKSIKTNKVFMMPNSWKKVLLFQSNKYSVIGYNEVLPNSTLIKMKKMIKDKIYDLTEEGCAIYNFNYLLKIEVIDLENNNKLVLDTFNGNIIENNNVNIEEITTKNGLNSVDKNFYYPKKNFKSFMIHLDKGNYITIKIDNYWIDLNNIKLYSNDFTNITGELIEHNENNKIFV